ncbi:MAG: hypothetical protein HC819_01690 [Cyclobacteriaceae bacterium]|nr:hypothetical protein [Cyclobacteriaceae bacterium]
MPGLATAYHKTLIIASVAVSGLFLFFTYATGSMPSDFSTSLLSAFGLAVASFSNAGLSDVSMLVSPAMVSTNFILQLGIVAGAALGNLGILVLWELFSPANLRKRMADPSIDWTYLTKVAVFCTLILFLLAPVLFYIIESNSLLKDKNIVESALASLYEISAARGFGHFLSDISPGHTGTSVLIAISVFGAGSFGTGGGASLLLIVLFFSFIIKSKNKEVYTAYRLMGWFIGYSAIIFILLLILSWLHQDGSSRVMPLLEQWLRFANIRSVAFQGSGWYENLLAALTILAGRIGFVVAGSLTLRSLNK